MPTPTLIEIFQAGPTGIVRKPIDCTKCGRHFFEDDLVCPQCEQPVYVSLDEWPEIIKRLATPGNKEAPKAFGWEVTVEFSSGSQKPEATFHWRGCTYRGAYRKGMLQGNAARILRLAPVTEDQWIACYGIGKM